jgi:hypothetical protein
MRVAHSVVTFLVVLTIGIAAGSLYDRVAGPSWLARQFSRSARGFITSAGRRCWRVRRLHIAVLLAFVGGLGTSVIAAAAGAAMMLFAWRMAK